MAFPKNIGASQFSRLAVSAKSDTLDDIKASSVVSAAADQTAATALGSDTFNHYFDQAHTGADLSTPTDRGAVEIGNVRDFPSFGTPANIVKVPQYGAKQTVSIQAQPDAPDLELTLNLVADKWKRGGKLDGIVGDNVTRLWMFAFLPTALEAEVIPDQPCVEEPAFLHAESLGRVQNALVFFKGRLESLLVTPARDEAIQGTLAMSVQSSFFGLFTMNG